jgi:hypothetical protein
MLAAGATFLSLPSRPPRAVWYTTAGFAAQAVPTGLTAVESFIPNARGSPLDPAEACRSWAIPAFGRRPPKFHETLRSRAAGRPVADSITEGASRKPRGAALAFPGAAAAKSALGFSRRLARVETLLASVRQSMPRRRRY